ncbi:outer membrane protein TolC [Thiogranum longum]|uniref:Outer membrane protein TolC n=1 Tax=Thiogranum longum TaxID=1537524 RepID=A0A4R1H910_9GAMM|nr:TolC family protein [Thiogranum longum]TCK18337.1 outer membrane protein TolC [Thiogranum longum]
MSECRINTYFRRNTAFSMLVGALSVLAMGLGPGISQAASMLTLEEAEQLAQTEDPAIIASRARAEALREQSVAAGQLPDPKLLLGMWNVPVDDFSISREPTTQLRTGIRQAFPRGNSLEYRQRSTEWMGKAEASRTRTTRLEIQRDVRQAWLELFYQQRAAGIVQQSRNLFQQLVEITRSHFASGRVSQQDVLQAQLELSRLDDRATRISKQADIQRARLSRWLGERAWAPIDETFPELPALPERDQLRTGLLSHPAIEAASARVESRQQLVKAAREQYKPGFNVGVEYRKRFGDNPDGSSRTDMMAAMVTLDLPLFTDKRQDRQLSASQSLAGAAIQAREQRLRELRRMLDADYARWERLGEQETLYRDNLLREAHANADAALSSYQNGINEFTSLMRARLMELEVSLQDIRIRVDRAKAAAALLFLAAELPDAQNNPGDNP